MNAEEIKKILLNPTEIFHTTQDDENASTVVVLAYSANREDELKQVAEDLKIILQEGDNAITINKSASGRCDLMITSGGLHTPFFFGDVRCTTTTYNELVYQKDDQKQVNLAFYIYSKEIETPQEQINNAMTEEGYDEHAVVSADELTFISEIIPVSGSFAVESDDTHINPAEFGD